MPESLVQVTEGSGKKLHTFQRTIGANSIEDEVTLLGENYLASYTVVAAASAATGLSHVCQIMAGATLKVRIRRVEVWQTAALTTGVITNFQLFRLTTAGTGGGAVTPNPLDTTDAASGATAMTLPTAKGVEGANIAAGYGYAIQTIGAATYTNPLLAAWDFDRPRSKPLIIPAGAANGIAVKNNAAYAGLTVVTMVWLDESNF